MEGNLKQQARRCRLALFLALALGLCLNITADFRGRGSVAFAVATVPFDAFQFNFDARHSGSNTSETTITPANAGSLRRLYQVRLPAVADGAGGLRSSGCHSHGPARRFTECRERRSRIFLRSQSSAREQAA